MIALKLNYKKLFIGFLAIALASCSDPWDDRKSDDVNLEINLTQAIANNPETSKFAEALVKTGYDKVLKQSKTFTVFVPTNDAMDKVSISILNNTDALVFFVQNHITLTSFSSVREKPSEKIQMFSNKFLVFKGTNLIDDAPIIDADNYVSNGVFHIVSKALTPKMNIWQFVNATTSSYGMSKYLKSLTELNIYKADSIAKLTTLPGFYSDSLSNSYLRNVYNLNNERNSYTLFLMEDGGYTTEIDKLKPYLTKNNAARTDTYSSYFTVRDLAFPKAYLQNELPSTLTTRFGVTVPIDKTQIVGSPIVLSNGIIYIMKKVDVPVVNRLVTTKIEGENNASYFPSTSANRSTIFYRDKKDPSGNLFNDIMQQHRVTEGPNFFINYAATDLYSTKYKVYWRAINDVQSNVYQQRLVVGSVFKTDGTIDLTTSLMAFPYMNVELKIYDEVYIGEFTLPQAGNIDTISLVSTATTTIGNNSLTLDYLKFVPVVK
jgi:hypothetical protein